MEDTSIPEEQDQLIVNPNEALPQRRIKAKVVIIQPLSLESFLSSEDFLADQLEDMTKITIANKYKTSLKVCAGDGTVMAETLNGLAPRRDLIGKGLWLHSNYEWLLVNSGITKMLFVSKKHIS